MDLASLRSIRLRELEMVLPLLPPHARILELGAGAGHQAERLGQLGYDVVALDVTAGEYDQVRALRITEYDGRVIPYPDCSFDVVFSSCLLEHVVAPAGLLRETRRVLRPGGRAVHVVPSSSWRLWSLLAHYPHLVRALVGRIRSNARRTDGGDASPPQSWRAVVRTLVPRRHGERGSALTELATYSRWSWRRLLSGAEFEVIDERPLPLFYTGEHLLGCRLSIEAREALARVLGSSCRVFVLEPRGNGAEAG